MQSSISLCSLALLGFTVVVNAVGPVTDLHVVNAAISPDGYERPAVVVNGMFPGPVITGKKVCIWNNVVDADMLTSRTVT